jgi:hypothetical protein
MGRSKNIFRNGQMTKADKFPYRECTWHHSDETSERWLSALEKTGAENVRARLALVTYGAVAAIAIGSEMNVTVGFAQEWLVWRDRLKSERDIARHERQIFWTRTAAIAACVAGTSAAIGWGWTIFFKP